MRISVHSRRARAPRFLLTETGILLRCAASLGALVLIGLLVPTLARADWTTPIDLSTSGRDAFEPQVAVAPDGDAVFTWLRSLGTTNSVVQARSVSADGELSVVRTVSQGGGDALGPQVAVGADGEAMLTWSRFNGTDIRVQARAIAADGTLGPIQNLSFEGQDASNPQVALDSNGNAVFAWTRSDGTNIRVQTRAIAADGTLSPVQNLSFEGQDASNPQVALDSNGNAVFTWTRSDGTDLRVQARARTDSGTLSPAQNLSLEGQDASNPQVALDPDGDAVFTWRRSDDANSQVLARARSASGVLSAVQSLSLARKAAYNPQVAVDADGDAVFAWRRSDGANSRVQARARSASGALSGVQNLSSAKHDASKPQVAVDAQGAASFAWQSTQKRKSWIQARERSAAGNLSAVQNLSDRGQPGLDPTVAVAGNGDAVFAWRRFDSTNFRIETEHLAPEQSGNPPNILIVLTDDQPKGTMRVMPQTREFFGSRGTEFTQAYDVQPLCCPSRASIFSGRYPHNHGITINDGTGFDATKTWQRYLHAQGYYTGIIGKYLNEVPTDNAPYFDFRVQHFDDVNEPASLKAYSQEFLRRAESRDDQPWALVYSSFSAHSPWTVKPRHPAPRPPYKPSPSIGEADLSDKHPSVAARAANWDPSRTEVMRTGQLDELEALDDGLKALYRDLKQFDEAPKTLGFYLSDNGLLWGQHSVTAKSWPYLESVNVPFYVRWPGHVAAGDVATNLVANIDIAPTIYAATGAQPGYPVDGQPIIGSPEREWLLLELPTYTPDQGVPPWSAYITPQREYIEWTDGFVEDYDLTSDPWQLSASNTADPTLAAQLDAAATCVGASCP